MFGGPYVDCWTRGHGAGRIEVLYILTCRKKITAPFADGAMRALGVSTAPVRPAIYGPGVWPCVSLSFLYKLIFRHVVNIYIQPGAVPTIHFFYRLAFFFKCLRVCLERLTLSIYSVA